MASHFITKSSPKGWFPGHELLIKTALTAIPTNFLTVYKSSIWAIQDIDRFRRSFMWRGDELDKVHHGHCLVRWKKCIRRRKLGGLGIKDLDKHSIALRLRWMWYNWDAVDRPWKNLLKIQDKTYRALFFASTVIIVGDGKHTPFWEAWWLNEMSPMQMAPNLYLQARYKFRLVHKELQNYNWIKNLKLINTEVLLEEFLLLFHALNDVSEWGLGYHILEMEQKRHVRHVHNCFNL
jgi:hypothetical protein